MKQVNPRAPLAALIAAFFTVACNHPARTITPVASADPRNFTWSVDTISSPTGSAVVMKSIWGSSASDVYVVGHNDLAGGTMYRFDGSRWRNVPLTAAEGGSIAGRIDLAQVFGFGPGDIVAVGGKTTGASVNSFAIHFNGTAWSEMIVPPGGMLNAVWGSYSGDMWAAGSPGTMLHSIGSTWLSMIFPDSVPCTALNGISGDDVYALTSGRGPRSADSTFHALWHWNGAIWSLADTLSHVPGRQDRFGTRSVWSLLAVLYTVGDGLYRQNVSGWDVLVPPSESGELNAVNGRVNRSLFVVGEQAAVYQVGPSDVYRYPQMTDPSVAYTGVWTNEREAFIVGSDGTKTFILHGK